MFGFLWGWVEFWIIRAASIAALATIFSESLHEVLRYLNNVSAGSSYLTFWQERWLTIGVILLLTLVNIQGVRWGGGLQFFITLVKMLSLLAILVLPFFFLGMLNGPDEMRSHRLGFTFTGLGTAFLAVLWPYHGWMNVAPIAGEVKEPQRNIPIAFLAGVGIIILLYLGANLAYHLVIPHDELAGIQGLTTVSYFAQKLLGPIGALFASAAVMISVFGALNGNILVGPRLLYAMGEDGLAPRALARLHPKHRTPVLATILLAAWSCGLILGGALLTEYQLQSQLAEVAAGTLKEVKAPKPIFDLLTDYAMFGAVTFETLAVSTIFVFRRKLPDVARPYRCPLFPWVPLLYLVVPAYVLVNMLTAQATEAALGFGFIGLGVVVYFGTVGRRQDV
ncbi:MAG: amino acid permease [Gemmataceae bacterium]